MVGFTWMERELAGKRETKKLKIQVQNIYL